MTKSVTSVNPVPKITPAETWPKSGSQYFQSPAPGSHVHLCEKEHCRETGISIEKQYSLILPPAPNNHPSISSCTTDLTCINVYEHNVEAHKHRFTCIRIDTCISVRRHQHIQSTNGATQIPHRSCSDGHIGLSWGRSGLGASRNGFIFVLSPGKMLGTMFEPYWAMLVRQRSWTILYPLEPQWAPMQHHQFYKKPLGLLARGFTSSLHQF